MTAALALAILAIAGCDGPGTEEAGRAPTTTSRTASTGGSVPSVPTSVAGDAPARTPPESPRRSTPGTSHGATPATSPARVLPPGPASATGLVANGECVGTPPRPTVILRWTPSGAGLQRVDVAITADGLAGGRFLSSGELPADAGRLDWDQARGEAEHHWRVLTRTATGWVSSQESVFTGPGCVGADRAG